MFGFERSFYIAKSRPQRKMSPAWIVKQRGNQGVICPVSTFNKTFDWCFFFCWAGSQGCYHVYLTRFTFRRPHFRRSRKVEDVYETVLRNTISLYFLRMKIWLPELICENGLLCSIIWYPYCLGSLHSHRVCTGITTVYCAELQYCMTGCLFSTIMYPTEFQETSWIVLLFLFWDFSSMYACASL